MPTKISIIGAAGTLGSCTSYRLATQGLADELVMIDPNQNLLKSHIMDIETAITGLQNTELREGADEDIEGSDIVIITAGAPWRIVTSRMEKLQENIPIIRETADKISKFCPEAVVITATNPVDPLNLAMHLLSGLDRRRILGYTLNDTARFKMLAARALGVQSTRLTGTVIGEHGDYAVLLFSSLMVDGAPVQVDELLKEEIRTTHVSTLKTAISLRTGWTSGWASSIGLAAMVSAITGKSGDTIPCSVLLKGEYGIDGISISVPVKLGREGVKEVVEMELAPDEEAAMVKSAEYLQDICREMKASLSG